jgi:hypothetical protein
MKKQNLKLKLIIALFFGCVVVFAQAGKENKNESNGNGKAMEQNLNEPNAVNPAKDNIQKYDRGNSKKVESSHPKSNLGNKYNRSSFEGSKQDSTKK